MFTFFESLVSFLEDSKRPFHFHLLVFFLAIFLRNFLEFFSTGAFPTFGSFVHYSLSYVCIALAFSLVFWLAVKVPLSKVMRVILPSFLVLVLAPLLDIFFTIGRGNAISYFMPGVHDNLLERFLCFFGPFSGAGATPGMRVEIALVLAACFAYFYLKKRSFLRSFFYSFALYCVLFAYGSVIFFVKAFEEFFGFSFFVSDFVMSSLYLCLVFLLSFPLFFVWNRDYFFALARDTRPFRIAHYLLMFFLGLAFALNHFPLAVEHFFALPLVLISIFFACLFVLSSNNVVDLEIDRVSNKARPFAAGKIPLSHYSFFSLGSLSLSLVYSFFAGPLPFFAVQLFVLGYSAYSLPPLRLKRIPFLAKLILSLNSLAFVLLGASFLHPTLAFFPFWLYPIFIFGFSLSMNFIDIKDFEGDRKAGIKTLPVLFGKRKAKMLIGICFFLTYASFSLLLGTGFLPALLALGLAQFFLLNKPDYDERSVFALYLASVLGFTALVFLGFA